MHGFKRRKGSTIPSPPPPRASVEKRPICMVSRGEKGQQCNLIQPKSTPHVQECRQQTRRINLAPNIVSVRTRKNTTVSMNCNIWATFTAYIRSCDDTGCSTRCQSRKRRNRVGAEISVSVKVTHHSPLQLTHHSSAHFKWPPSHQVPNSTARGGKTFLGCRPQGSCMLCCCLRRAAAATSQKTTHID